MEDFFETLDFYAFDVDKAVANSDSKPMHEIINEILEEVGLNE